MKELNDDISSKFRFIFGILPYGQYIYISRIMSNYSWFDEVNTMGYFEKL